MPFFGQEILIEAGQRPAHRAALSQARQGLKWSEDGGGIMDKHQLAPYRADRPGAHAGPHCGVVDWAGVHLRGGGGYPALRFRLGTFWFADGHFVLRPRLGEPKLIALSYAFEQAAKARIVPQLLPTAAIDA